jgi:Planctomycete cytochrome C
MTDRTLPLAGAALFALALAALPFAIHPAAAQHAPPPNPLVVSYKDDLAPIFRGYCASCHAPGGEGYEQSGLDLTSYQGLMKGTKFGPMVVPGQPDASSLVVLIEGRAAPQLRMPHGQKQLPSCLRNEIWTWIFQGAKDN